MSVQRQIVLQDFGIGGLGSLLGPACGPAQQRTRRGAVVGGF